MKKFWARILSIVLALTTLCTLGTPIGAYAKTADKITLSVEKTYLEYAYISWKSTRQYFDGVSIEQSTDKKKWETVTEYYDANGSYDVSLSAKKVLYFRVRPFHYKGYDWETGEEIFEYEKPSNVVKLFPKLNYFYAYTECNRKYATVTWSIDPYDKRFIDGFDVYYSVNGSKWKLMGAKNVKKPYSKSEWEYTYRYRRKAPSKYGYTAKYLIRPYFMYKQKKYYLNMNSGLSADTYLAENFTAVIPDDNTVTVVMRKLGGHPTFKITYRRYNIRTGNYSRTKTVKTAKNYYIINNAVCKNYTYEISVAPVWGKTEGESVYLYSHEPHQIMNRTKKVNNTTIPVINTREKTSYVDYTFSLTAEDYNIIDNFFYSVYKGNNPSRAEMAEYALNWIHKNVDYAYDYSQVDGLSYVDAIFNKKKGQCLQYNGAFAEVLAYLGYESRVIKGWRTDGDGNPTVSHYWCEVKALGRWYLCETGNYGKNGSWKYFCSLYADSRGYTKNGVAAYDE